MVTFIGAVLSAQNGIIAFLGGGDDLLIGDPDSQVLFPGNVEAVGGNGSDTVLNAAYFSTPAALNLFETIVE